MIRALRSFLFFALCVLMWPAVAQTTVMPRCLPAPAPASSDGWIGSVMTGGLSKNGAWITWTCFKGTLWTDHTYVGTTAELSKVGSRLQTIMKSTDPLKTLQTAPSRFAITTLDDPALAAVVADMKTSDGGLRVTFALPAVPASITTMLSLLNPNQDQ